MLGLEIACCVVVLAVVHCGGIGAGCAGSALICTIFIRLKSDCSAEWTPNRVVLTMVSTHQFSSISSTKKNIKNIALRVKKKGGA